MQRIGFRLRVKPEKLDAYIAIHAEVWPDMQNDLLATGVQTYSIFADGPELFAYLECESWGEFQHRMAQSVANHRWQAYMREFLATPVDADGVESPNLLSEIFYLHKA